MPAVQHNSSGPSWASGTEAGTSIPLSSFFMANPNTPASAMTAAMDNAADSIIDNVWAWRADHGNAVGWTVNTGDTGLVVTGNDVTAYGPAVILT